MSALTDFIDGIPKAELHLHIEGTLEPELMLELAARNGLRSRFASVEAARAAYQFDSLQSFLDIYYEGARCLLTERDFYDLTWAYAERAHADNVIHCEIFFDPQTHTDRGVPFETVISGITRALSDAAARLGMSARLILCFLRHESADAAMATLETALPYKDRIIGVGLDSSEVGHPPEKFKDVFARARAEGFLAVAHAGEEGPASYIRGALDALGARRIDHGVRCEEDPALVRRLVEERIPLTVCPLSNLKLRVVDSMKDHPLKRLLDAGLQVTVNSDDPAYFGGYINDNYRAVAEALHLSRDDILRLARGSFHASFLDDARRASCLAAVDAYLARAPSA